MAVQPKRRMNPKDSKHRKKKVSPLSPDQVNYVDYKDVDLLRRFMSDRAKIRGRRVTGNNVQQQRLINTAVKNAREMGLLPYNSAVTTQRRGAGGGGRGRRDDRDDRGDRYGGNDEDVPKVDDAVLAPADDDVTEDQFVPVGEADATGDADTTTAEG